jgi:retron-type reverse transcriptase
MAIEGGYIIDMDSGKYADRSSDDTIPHGQVRKALGQRLSDGVIEWVIGKWLHAGVMEAGNVRYSENGTPQGAKLDPQIKT